MYVMLCDGAAASYVGNPWFHMSNLKAFWFLDLFFLYWFEPDDYSGLGDAGLCDHIPTFSNLSDAGLEVVSDDAWQTSNKVPPMWVAITRLPIAVTENACISMGQGVKSLTAYWKVPELLFLQFMGKICCLHFGRHTDPNI